MTAAAPCISNDITTIRSPPDYSGAIAINGQFTVNNLEISGGVSLRILGGLILRNCWGEENKFESIPINTHSTPIPFGWKSMMEE